MLRTEMEHSEKVLIVKLEGRLASEDAEHVRTLLTRCDTERGLLVDLTEVIFVDSVGEETLSFFGRLGAKFVAEDAYVLGLCKQLNLPLARHRKREAPAPPLKATRAANPD